MKKELTPEEIISQYKADGWQVELILGGYSIFVKAKLRVGINNQSGEVVSLNDDDMERYQTKKDGEYAKRYKSLRHRFPRNF